MNATWANCSQKQGTEVSSFKKKKKIPFSLLAIFSLINNICAFDCFWLLQWSCLPCAQKYCCWFFSSCYHSLYSLIIIESHVTMNMINPAAFAWVLQKGNARFCLCRTALQTLLPYLRNVSINLNVFVLLCRRPRGVISTPLIRTFGRGIRYHGRGFKSQGLHQVSFTNHYYVRPVPFAAMGIDQLLWLLHALAKWTHSYFIHFVHTGFLDVCGAFVP